jgi:hypothetical protein
MHSSIGSKEKMMEKINGKVVVREYTEDSNCVGCAFVNPGSGCLGVLVNCTGFVFKEVECGKGVVDTNDIGCGDGSGESVEEERADYEKVWWTLMLLGALMVVMGVWQSVGEAERIPVYVDYVEENGDVVMEEIVVGE